MTEELRATLENAIEEHSEPVQVESAPAVAAIETLRQHP